MKKIYTYVCMLCLGLLALSCNDWLDVKPQAQVEAEDMFKKPRGFEDALVACYVKMNTRALYGKEMTMTAVEFLAQHWDHTSGNYRSEDKLKDYQYNTVYADTTFSNIYEGLYNVIAQANIILENLSTKGDVIQNPELRKLIEAEALGIRAFCHMDVLRLFGQLPAGGNQQVQLPYAKTVSTAMVPYYSYQDYIRLILEDIQAAQLLFKESDPLMTYTFNQLDEFTKKESPVEIEDDFWGYRRFRFNYYAMEALKARVYRYEGKASEAFEAANNVINARSKSGEMMVELAGNNDFNKKYYALPSECILALSNNQIEKNTEYLFEYDKLFLFKRNFESLFQGQKIGTNNRTMNVWNSITDNQGTPKALLRKYEQPEDNEDDLLDYTKFQVIPLIRLSEMYLIAIESAATLSEANAYYTLYMAARDVQAAPLTAETLHNEIINEYRREFFAEGQVFYMYKRLNVKKIPWKTDREVTEKDYIVPLPTTELGSN